MSSNAAAMLFFGNRIWPRPWMLENSSQPSSSSTIARVKLDLGEALKQAAVLEEPDRAS